MAQNPNPKDQEEKERILKSLSDRMADDEREKEPWEALGPRRWVDKAGKHLTGKIESISKDGESITLKEDGTDRKVTRKIANMSAEDQELIKGMRAMPHNITLNPAGLTKKREQQWLEGVIVNFGILSDLPDGKDLLGRIGKRTNRIEIVPRTSRDNKIEYNRLPRGATNTKITYDPFDPKGDVVVGGGDRSRPPYIALGKELSTGERALTGDASGNDMVEENKAAEFENTLRDQHNEAASKRGERRLPRRVVPE